MARSEPTPVALAYGDAYLARLGRECLRLDGGLQAISVELDKRHGQIIAGLGSRRLTRLDVDGVHLRLTRAGLVIA